ncbi:MAG: uracil-DNA glycosylase [bacterium]
MTDQPPEEVSVDEELAALVGGLRTHLGWLAGHGCAYLPAGSSPRISAPPQELDREDRQELHAEGIAPGGRGDSPVLVEPGAGARGLERIRADLGDCQRCRLAEGRIQLVFGQGNPEAALMFVGEAPGRDEDLAGQAFVGAAGALLTKMIRAMGLDREQVFIGNVIKCRPPRNRNPEPDEIDCCAPYLWAQLRAIQPQVIVTLGRFAAQTLLDTDASISRLRGSLHTFRLDDREIALMPTYHPAYLLRNPEAKRPVWEDLKQVMGFLTERGLG